MMPITKNKNKKNKKSSSKELELPSISDKFVNPSDQLLDLLIKELADLFSHDARINLGSSDLNLKKASYLVRRSLEPWGEKSPRNFRSKLIACISAFGPRSNRVGQTGSVRIVDEALSRVTPLLNIVETTTTNTEKEFIGRRFKKYLEEYDFNESSDVSLLRQLISAEYIAGRLEFAQRQDWKHPQKYSSALQNIENRMMKLMEKLGVTRSQREDDDVQLSNIAELAQSFDMKQKKSEELEKSNKDEINLFERLRKKDHRDEVNVISDSEYELLEKKMGEMEKIDADKYFDIGDMDIDDIEDLIGVEDSVNVGTKKDKSKQV